MQDPAGEAGTRSEVMYSYGPPHMAKQKQDDQLEHTYSSYVRIRDVALNTCQRRWMIWRSGERRPGIFLLAVRHDDDDDGWVNKFQATGSVNNLIKKAANPKSGKKSAAIYSDNVDAVRNSVWRSPKISLRRRSKKFHLSRELLLRNLKKDLQLNPYWIQIKHKLTSAKMEFLI